MRGMSKPWTFDQKRAGRDRPWVGDDEELAGVRAEHSADVEDVSEGFQETPSKRETFVSLSWHTRMRRISRRLISNTAMKVRSSLLLALRPCRGGIYQANLDRGSQGADLGGPGGRRIGPWRHP